MLHHISERDYFTRVWTVQECILAQKVVLFCGKSRVALDVFTSFLKQQNKSLIKSSSLLRLASFLDHSAGRNETLSSISQELDLRGSSTQIAFQPLDPATAIIRYAFRECKDPRDHIFGIHSLMVPAARERISIDYDMPLFNILLEYISSQGDLLDQGALEMYKAGHGFSNDFVANLGEVMLSIRVLVQQFSAASSEFRRTLDTFFERRRHKCQSSPSFSSDASVVVVCPVQYHKITTSQRAAQGTTDVLVKPSRWEELIQLGLRPGPSPTDEQNLPKTTAVPGITIHNVFAVTKTGFRVSRSTT